MSARISLSAFDAADEKRGEIEAKNSMTMFSVNLIGLLEKGVSTDLVNRVAAIGDYNGMDTEKIGGDLQKHAKDYPEEIMILCGFAAKNGGVIDLPNLDKFSGSDKIRQAVSKLNVWTKPKKTKQAPPRNAITLPRIATFFHPIVIDMMGKWKVPPAAGVDFLLIASPVFKSPMAPYMYEPKTDSADKIVYWVIVEWQCAHHDQVNPDPAKDSGAVKPKFNKGIMDLKIRTTAVPVDLRARWTKTIKDTLEAAKYKPGATYPDSYTRNGFKAPVASSV